MPRRLAQRRAATPCVGAFPEADPPSRAMQFWTLAEESCQIGWFERDFVSGEVRASPQTRAIYALPAGPIEIDDWMARLHPEDRARVEDAEREAFAHSARIASRISHFTRGRDALDLRARAS